MPLKLLLFKLLLMKDYYSLVSSLLQNVGLSVAFDIAKHLILLETPSVAWKVIFPGFLTTFFRYFFYQTLLRFSRKSVGYVCVCVCMCVYMCVSQLESEGSLEIEFPCSQETSIQFLLKPTDWMRPPCVMKDNLLHSKFTNC